MASKSSVPCVMVIHVHHHQRDLLSSPCNPCRIMWSWSDGKIMVPAYVSTQSEL
jgi:hypothetical protein